MVKRANGGDRQAGDQLFTALWYITCSYAKKRLFSNEAQQQFEQQFLNSYPDFLRSYRPMDNVKFFSWYSVVMRNWADRIITDFPRQSHLCWDEYMSPDLSSCDSGSSLREALCNALQQLHPKDLNLLQLRYPELLQDGRIEHNLRMAGVQPGGMERWRRLIEQRCSEAGLRAGMCRDNIYSAGDRIERLKATGDRSDAAVRKKISLCVKRRTRLRQEMIKPAVLSYGELSEMYGCSQTLVGRSLRRIREQLRTVLLNGRPDTRRAV